MEDRSLSCGYLITKRLREKGMTQKALADQLGVDAARISRVAGGKERLGSKYWALTCAILEIEQAELETLPTLKRPRIVTFPKAFNPVHIQAMGAMESPNENMQEVLRAVESLLGFPLSKDTCISLLRDYVAAYEVDEIS